MVILKDTNRSHTMTRVKKLALVALSALALTAGAVAATPAAELAGDPSQWGVAKKGSFDITDVDAAEVARKVNEYEGQHLG